MINEQLKFSIHYDFGLRTIKAVLLYAGLLKLRAMSVKSEDSIILKESRATLREYLEKFREKPEESFSMSPKGKPIVVSNEASPVKSTGGSTPHGRRGKRREKVESNYMLEHKVGEKVKIDMTNQVSSAKVKVRPEFELKIDDSVLGDTPPRTKESLVSTLKDHKNAHPAPASAREGEKEQAKKR
jgi:hypothetical protein